MVTLFMQLVNDELKSHSHLYMFNIDRKGKESRINKYRKKTKKKKNPVVFKQRVEK